jgi:hypothetical protein
MATTPPRPFLSPCRQCSNDTNHETLQTHNITETDEYHCANIYRIIRCLGCDTVSFREDFHDYQSAYDRGDGEWIYPTTTETYPKALAGHRALAAVGYVPPLVRTIYKETLGALREDAFILAGLGLRGTIEAICNDCQVPGRNLEERISKLAASGLITKREAERLHGIRFLGNDAAHKLKEPKHGQLMVALKIIEHLLNSLYIFEHEVDEELELSIGTIEGLKKLLAPKIAGLQIGDVHSLADILGSDRRRLVGGTSASLEAELKSQIGANQYAYLTLGAIVKVGTPSKDVQTYVIAAHP